MAAKPTQPTQTRESFTLSSSPLAAIPRRPDGLRTSTGIPGLDQILNGGVPTGRSILVSGGPGTGKTILSCQFLVNGVLRHNEPSTYISLDEERDQLFEEMREFGWNLEALEASGKFSFVDASPSKFAPPQIRDGKLVFGRNSLTLPVLGDMIRASTQKVRAKRLVIDPVTALGFPYPGIIQRRYALVELMAAVRSTGATCLMTTELRKNGFDRTIGAEEYLAHGVILLQQLAVGRSFARVIQVEKMRRTQIDTQPRPYSISKSGIEVFAKETIL